MEERKVIPNLLLNKKLKELGFENEEELFVEICSVCLNQDEENIRKNFTEKVLRPTFDDEKYLASLKQEKNIDIDSIYQSIDSISVFKILKAFHTVIKSELIIIINRLKYLSEELDISLQDYNIKREYLKRWNINDYCSKLIFHILYNDGEIN